MRMTNRIEPRVVAAKNKAAFAGLPSFNGFLIDIPAAKEIIVPTTIEIAAIEMGFTFPPFANFRWTCFTQTISQ